MINYNRDVQAQEEQVKAKIQRQKRKKERLLEEIANQKNDYESRIMEIQSQKMEAQVDLTAFYH